MFILYIISSPVTGRTQLYYLCEVSLEIIKKKQLKFALPPTRNIKFALPPMQNPNTNQWNIGCVGHVHVMLFVSISCALGSQCERPFQLHSCHSNFKIIQKFVSKRHQKGFLRHHFNSWLGKVSWETPHMLNRIRTTAGELTAMPCECIILLGRTLVVIPIGRHWS